MLTAPAMLAFIFNILATPPSAYHRSRRLTRHVPTLTAAIIIIN